MSVRIEFTQTKTIEAGPLYKVNNVVNVAQSIPPEIFVHNTTTQAFEHVATLWDMNNIPGSLQGAIDNDMDYYRLSTGYKEYESLTTASNFEAYVYSRVVSLVQDYAAAIGDFPGEVRRIVTE